ncbi:hypothetical protein phiA829_092 [Aeromonas phage phiA8-29]|uniref:HNH nuclease domain-containing protein n=1 Tax=Aeromonas phage phiA8-29 TaxID=1978922 RepID=A0A1W6DYR0_9CAUD|nr:homing endonuclease [Aeromonas phage phiA8-29]ARK07912.1 hypothetical protein phiA829_092 [Aeromonas phage phiA8-29]
MNYIKIYFQIIERAKNRKELRGYAEIHHIEPICIGGSDDEKNLVKLTAKEHFIAHLLLAKAYPGEPGLVTAAFLMRSNPNNKRKTVSKEYSWLKRAHQENMKRIQSGVNNSQFGSTWIHNPTTGEIKKIDREQIIPEGFFHGRNSKSCDRCSERVKTDVKYCKECREAVLKDFHRSRNVFLGREQEFYRLYDEHKNINKVCKLMGFPASDSHWFYGAKKLLERR